MLQNLRFALAPALIISLLAPYFAIAALPPPLSTLPPKENLLQFQLNKGFGGKITDIDACLIPPALLLTIGPPAGGEYLLMPSSITYAFRVFLPGVWTLGLAQPQTTPCLVRIKGKLRSIGDGHPIIMIGTGAVPSPFKSSTP